MYNPEMLPFGKILNCQCENIFKVFLLLLSVNIIINLYYAWQNQHLFNSFVHSPFEKENKNERFLVGVFLILHVATKSLFFFFIHVLMKNPISCLGLLHWLMEASNGKEFIH